MGKIISRRILSEEGKIMFGWLKSLWGSSIREINMDNPPVPPENNIIQFIWPSESFDHEGVCPACCSREYRVHFVERAKYIKSLRRGFEVIYIEHLIMTCRDCGKQWVSLSNEDTDDSLSVHCDYCGEWDEDLISFEGDGAIWDKKKGLFAYTHKCKPREDSAE